MAGKKKNGAPEKGSVVHLHMGAGAPPSDNTADSDEIEALDAIEDGALSRAIDEVRNTEGAKAEVHRVLPAERAGFCRTYAISVWSHERVATDWGPGRYRVRFKGPGDKYIPGGSTFSIAEGVAAAGVPAAGAVESVLALFKAERERDEADRAKKKGEWLEWAKLLAPLLAPKILDMLGGAKGLGPRDLIGMLKDMKELQAPAADLNSQFQQVVGILQGAKDLVGDTGEKTGSTWVDLLRDFMGSPAMGALANAIPGLGVPRLLPSSIPTAAAPMSGTVNAAPPVPAGNSVSAPATATVSSPEMLQQLQWLRGTLTQLLAQAQKPNSNPRLYGEVVLDNLPPFIDEQALLDRLKSTEWLTQLSQVDARVTQHQEWFQRFRDYAVKALTRKLAKAAEQASAESAQAPPLPDRNQPMQDEGGSFE